MTKDEEVKTPNNYYVTGLRPPEHLSLSGPVSENWKKWLQKFEYYADAINLDKVAPKSQVGTFMAAAGPEVDTILDSLSLLPTDLQDIEKIKQALGKYFLPKKSLTYERYLFNIRNQGPDESIDSYITILRNLLKECTFGCDTCKKKTKEQMLLDRIILGTKIKDVIERLLREISLTLEQAIILARAFESTQKQIKEMKTRDDAPSGSNANRIQRSNPKSSQKQQPSQATSTFTCYNCGGNHIKNRCPAKGKI